MVWLKTHIYTYAVDHVVAFSFGCMSFFSLLPVTNVLRITTVRKKKPHQYRHHRYDDFKPFFTIISVGVYGSFYHSQLSVRYPTALHLLVNENRRVDIFMVFNNPDFRFYFNEDITIASMRSSHSNFRQDATPGCHWTGGFVDVPSWSRGLRRFPISIWLVWF